MQMGGVKLSYIQADVIKHYKKFSLVNLLILQRYGIYANIQNFFMFFLNILVRTGQTIPTGHSAEYAILLSKYPKTSG